MSELPPFDSTTGYLPPGWHPGTPETLHQRCVKIHADREPIYRGYCKLHDALQMLGIPSEQWIGGALVSLHGRTAHADVANFCDAHTFEHLPAELRALILTFLRGAESIPHCQCNSHLVSKGPPDHPCNAEYLRLFNFWHKLLGHDHVGRPKGIVGITIEPPPPPEEDDEPAA